MSGLEYYVLDTETTGLSKDNNEINQISILRVSDGFQRTINIKVRWPESASKEALNVQGITREDLSRGIESIEAIYQVNDFFEEDGKTSEHRCIVAHNAAFDRKFCHATWERDGKQFPADLWLCTMAFAKKHANKEGLEKIASIQGTPKPKYGLDMYLKAVGIKPKSGAHSAAIDVQNTLSLFNVFMNSGIDHLPIIKREPHRIAGQVEFYEEY